MTDKINKLRKTILIPISVLLCFQIANAQVAVLNKAHAHNDYLQERPLFDALDNGFLNIEVDVFLIKDELIVSHIYPAFRKKTIDELYLKPLLEIHKKNNGSIYTNNIKPLVLLIDFKNKAEESYLILKQKLLKYNDLIWAKNINPDKSGSVQFIISGNRPIKLMLADSTRTVYLDGRPNELTNNFQENFMPWVSTNYKKLVDSPSKIPLSTKDMEIIKNLATKVHHQNKKLRLWGTPHNEILWEQIENLGADILISDNLEQMNTYFNNK